MTENSENHVIYKIGNAVTFIIWIFFHSLTVPPFMLKIDTVVSLLLSTHEPYTVRSTVGVRSVADCLPCEFAYNMSVRSD